MIRRTATIAAAVLMAVASLAGAQRGESATARPLAPRGARRADARDQQALVRRVRQAFSGVVKRQLNLSDDQTQQLQRVELKYQRQRSELQRQEKQARVALANAILDTTSAADQSKVAGYMDQLIAAQHKRADLLEAEQKDLSAFLTPLQRAKYQGLKEQLNKRVTQMRQQGGAARGAPPPDER